VFKLGAFTQGCNIPSTRFRWSQYVPYLQDSGFNVKEFGSHFGAYAPESLGVKLAWFPATVSESVIRAMRSYECDISFLQRNLVATLMTSELLLKKPVVFDVDDAIFLGRGGKAADKIAERSSLVICGNDFLADHFSQFNTVKVLPTAVDVSRFRKIENSILSRRIIGWSGTSSGFKFLYQIEWAIACVLKKYPDVIFKVVADKSPSFSILPAKQVLFEKWSAVREVDVLNEFSIGIMPLEDTLWARGKCSFKMLTYMAVGIPVIVSPIGMNKEVLNKGEVGYAALSVHDWVEAMESLLESPGLSVEMGIAGQEIIKKYYSSKVIGNQLARLIHESL